MFLENILKLTETQRFDSIQAVNSVLLVKELAAICVDSCSSLAGDFQKVLLITLWHLDHTDGQAQVRNILASLRSSRHELAKSMMTELTDRRSTPEFLTYISGKDTCQRVQCWPDTCLCNQPVIPNELGF